MLFNLYGYCRAVTLTACCLFLGSATIFAQKSKPNEPIVKLGQITSADFSQNPFPQDSSTEAIVLYERGDVSFDLSGPEILIFLNYHKRVKILKKSAYERATVEVPFYKAESGQAELVSDIEGYTYNLEGGIVHTEKLTKAGIFTEKVSNTVSLQKFTLPNVREGSIIDYHYQLTTPFAVNYNPRTWTFQERIPVAWSEYRINVTSYFYYKMIMGGYLPLAINESGSDAQTYRFVVQNAPAFRDEAYMTTANDYLSKIDFELASYALPGQFARKISVSWEDMDKTLLASPYFGSQYSRAAFLHDAANTINKTNTDTLARLAAACRFISSQIKWDEGENIFSYGIKKAFDARKGDAGDINLMLIALLREMDFDANPVILSTRSHGHVNEEHALVRKFNYVVAHISLNGKDFLMDATNPILKPGMLPMQCLNGMGRLVVAGKSRFVPLTPTERDVESYSGTFTINSEGDITGILKKSHGGYSALDQKRLYVVDGETKYLAEVKKKKPAWQIEKAVFAGIEQNEAPFDATYTLSIPEACQHAGDRLYLKPLLTEAHEYSPFKEPARLYPVDLGVPIDETYLTTFTLPDGYQVEEAPKSLILTIPENGGRFTYQVNINGNQVQVMSRLLLRKPLYQAEEYPVLREFFDKVVAKQAEQIVLKRTGSIAEKK